MTTVISKGTGVRAALGPGQFAAGKTGTTENSGDAWFVGFTKRWTVAVWVGYPDKLKPMLTEFAGAPVEGGTYPALIWHDFMVAANAIADERNAKERARKGLAAQAARRPDDHHHPGTGHPDAAGARARGRRRRGDHSAGDDRRPPRARRGRARGPAVVAGSSGTGTTDHAARTDRHHTARGSRRRHRRRGHRRRHQRAVASAPLRRRARAAATGATRGGCRARRSASRGRRPS